MFRRLWLALVPLLLALPALAQDDPEPPEDPERARVREALGELSTYRQVGDRIRQLARELEDGEEWVPRSIVLVELADTEDRRAVAALASVLEDDSPYVSAFALHGLARFGAEDLRKGGGRPLVEGLIEAFEVRTPFHREVGHALLVRVVGEDLGGRKTRWRSWLRRNGDDLEIEIEGPGVSLDGFDPEVVRDVQRVMTGSGTAVRPRIPDITSQVRELNRSGLEVALCLDQTGSMTAVIEEAKRSLEVLMGVLGVVVEDYRVGLVTYDDGVRVNEGLTQHLGRLTETLDRVQAAGGADFPEGVDKALGAALQGPFGWSRDAVKVVVVVGDAPPHPEDLEDTLNLVGTANAQADFVVHAVSTGGTVDDLVSIAEAGGGRHLQLSQPDQLISEILLLIFGEGMRPAMERFVPVLKEILTTGQE